MFEFHGVSDDIPKEHRRFLREAGEPAPGVFVGYAPYDGPPRSTFTYLPLDTNVIEDPPPADGPPTPVGYNYVGAFGYVAFKVFGLVDAPGDVIEAPPSIVHQVWPNIANDTSWPTLPPYVGNDLLKLAMFVPARGRF